MAAETDRMSKAFLSVVAGDPRVTPADARSIYTQGYAGVNYQTPVDRLVTGSDGTVWLRRGSFGSATAEWLSFDRTFAPTGTVTLPAATRVLNVARDTIWVVELDEDDVSHVVRYALDRPAQKR
jgi:hypothetical protein